MNNYVNPMLGENPQTESYETVKNPSSFFADHKAKKGIIVLTAAQRDADGNTVQHQVGAVNMIVLALRYRMKGEAKDGASIQSPLLLSTAQATPLFKVYKGKTATQVGDKDFTWNSDKKELRAHGEVKEISSVLHIFGIMYRETPNGVKGQLVQLDLRGHGFGKWIEAATDVDLTTNFNLSVVANGETVPNEHPKAAAGEMLTLPGLELSPLSQTVGEFYNSPAAVKMVSELVAYLDNRTFGAKKMPGTTAAVNAVAQPSAAQATAVDDDLPF